MITFLDFYADWCGPCRFMKPIFEEVEKEYAGKVEFKTVDVEVEHEMSSKFGILNIPTFVILKNNQEVDRKSGAMPKEALKSWLDSHLS